MFKRVIFTLASVASIQAFGAWDIAPDESSLHFLTTKNAQVTEVHSFETLSGTLSEDGKLTVSVDLASVNTLIPIRNTRMQEMLFNVAQFPTATFSADIDKTLLNVPVGKQIQATVTGMLKLHGVEAPAEFAVHLTRSTKGKFVVSTTKPGLIRANTFKLEQGVEALRNIAGLNSITLTVPVTFSVTFEH